ncbi:hypothetical protein PAXINDRAFT_8580 [Paxillus involutus ATCC 200175]|nr:hypothetical protein PAXINDRAFT_8580 [Paxillus involutus ATCC 200175]
MARTKQTASLTTGRDPLTATEEQNEQNEEPLHHQEDVDIGMDVDDDGEAGLRASSPLMSLPPLSPVNSLPIRVLRPMQDEEMPDEMHNKFCSLCQDSGVILYCCNGRWGRGWNTAPKQQGVKFKQHLSGRKNCDMLSEAFMAYLRDEFNPELTTDEEEDCVGSEKGEKVVLKKSETGDLILPDRGALKLPGQKDAIRQIVNEAYGDCSTQILGCRRDLFIPIKCLLEHLDAFPDPSKLTGTQVKDVWDCWSSRQKRGEAMVVFTASKKGDMRAEVEKKRVRRKGKKNYVEVDYEAQSPAAHSSDRAMQLAFLCTLSKASAYQDLVQKYSEMKTTPRPEPPLSLEPWCSWEWPASTLPAEFHDIAQLEATLTQFSKALPATRSSIRFGKLTLALGLLLRDITKVLELEPDVDPFPAYLGLSPFSHQHFDQVLNLVVETRDRISATTLTAPEGPPTTVSTNAPAPQQEEPVNGGPVNVPGDSNDAKPKEKCGHEDGEEEGSLVKKKPRSRAPAVTPAPEIARPKRNRQATARA